MAAQGRVMTATHDPFVGKKLGRYQIETLLGYGRAATVYRARDPIFNRKVAIKVLNHDIARDPQIVETFLHDVRMLTQLSHPNILPIYEANEQAGTAYLVRALTDDGTLQSRLQHAGRLAVEEAIELLRPVASALDYAHRHRIYHHNLKPTNILFTTTGQVFVTDFSVPGQSNSIATTMIGGLDAPAYVAPEQVENRAVDHRADLYLLGVILYEALTGQPPFQGTNARAVIKLHQHAPPPLPRSLNPALSAEVEQVLLRALEKQPDQRYQKGADLFFALSKALQQQSPGTPASTIVERPALPIAAQTTLSASSGEVASAPDPITVALPQLDSESALATGETDEELDWAAPPLPGMDAPLDQEEETSLLATITSTSMSEPTQPASVMVDPPTWTTPAPVVLQPAPMADPEPARHLPVKWIVPAALLALLVVGIAAGIVLRSRSSAPTTTGNSTASTSPTATPAAPMSGKASAALSVSSAAPVVASTAPAPASPAPPTATAVPAVLRHNVILVTGQQPDATGTQLLAIAADGGAQRPLTSLPARAWGGKIAPDGRSIVFSVAGSAVATPQIAASGLAGQGVHELFLFNTIDVTLTQLTTTNAWNAAGSWSPDGKTLAFTTNRDGNWEIYTLSFPGLEQRRLTTNAAQDGWPAWLPDGQHLVFTSTRDDYSQIYSMDADGSNVVRLNYSESQDFYPAVSPDGAKIAYAVQMADDASDIFVMNSDGSGATRITDGGYNTLPTWSPDSASIAFVSRQAAGKNRIVVMRPDGGERRELPGTTGDPLAPDWRILALPGALTRPVMPSHLAGEWPPVVATRQRWHTSVVSGSTDVDVSPGRDRGL